MRCSMTFPHAVLCLITQSCPALCDPMNSFVHGVLQVRILELVAMPSSRGSTQPRDRTQGLNPGPLTASRFFTM